MVGCVVFRFVGISGTELIKPRIIRAVMVADDVRGIEFFQQQFDQRAIFARLTFFTAGQTYEIEQEACVQITALFQGLRYECFGDAIEASPDSFSATFEDLFFAARVFGDVFEFVDLVLWLIGVRALPGISLHNEEIKKGAVAAAPLPDLNSVSKFRIAK